jgi:hypothetical protein
MFSMMMIENLDGYVLYYGMKVILWNGRSTAKHGYRVFQVCHALEIEQYNCLVHELSYFYISLKSKLM